MRIEKPEWIDYMGESGRLMTKEPTGEERVMSGFNRILYVPEDCIFNSSDEALAFAQDEAISLLVSMYAYDKLQAKLDAQQTLIDELVGALESIYKRINFQQTHSPHRMRLWLEHTKQDAAAALAKQVKGDND